MEQIMTQYVLPLIIGIICIVLGIFNMRGNISSIHSYHRHRVSEENRIPFGRKVGLGTIVIGASIVIFSILSAIAVYTETQVLSIIGAVIIIIGLLIGLGLSFYAMFKYNKGIF